MNISVSVALEEMIRRKVESGVYESVGQVIQEAFLLLEERDQVTQMRCERLRTEIIMVNRRAPDPLACPIYSDAEPLGMRCRVGGEEMSVTASDLPKKIRLAGKDPLEVRLQALPPVFENPRVVWFHPGVIPRT